MGVLTIFDCLLLPPFPGRFIRCDECNDPARDFTCYSPWNMDGYTERKAEDAGWRVVRNGLHSSQHLHYCPHCARSINER